MWRDGVLVGAVLGFIGGVCTFGTLLVLGEWMRLRSLRRDKVKDITNVRGMEGKNGE